MEYKLGALKPKIDKRDYVFHPAGVVSEEQLPKTFKLDMPAIRDQGPVNSCAAHAAETIAEYYNLHQTGDVIRLSPGYIYGCRYNYTGEGMYLRDALKTLKKRGICRFGEFPHNEEVPNIIKKFKEVKEWHSDYPNRISTYFSIDKDDVTNIKLALLRNGPLMVSIPWQSDFKLDCKNVLYSKSNCNAFRGYHAVVVYGWNEKGWLIQNSWGKNWGDKGRATYPYAFEEVWGTTDDIYNEDVKKIETNWITNIL